ncbi:uncharacterized protein LOC116420901 [Sarcophilus harrisii]|uniref:uncharacterized protein LOC116420901 n=1 Tax=Sarcophilus harrisii TaxID=9305 RepID=UPI001301D0C0|nr:uncharacterized protein LOC116420901 [Sarcophilus harrisii]
MGAQLNGGLQGWNGARLRLMWPRFHSVGADGGPILPHHQPVSLGGIEIHGEARWSASDSLCDPRQVPHPSEEGSHPHGLSLPALGLWFPRRCPSPWRIALGRSLSLALSAALGPRGLRRPVDPRHSGLLCGIPRVPAAQPREPSPGNGLEERSSFRQNTSKGYALQKTSRNWRNVQKRLPLPLHRPAKMAQEGKKRQSNSLSDMGKNLKVEVAFFPESPASVSS